MAGSRNTRQIGSVTRIYKNGNGKVIAIDDVSVHVDQLRLTDVKFHNAVSSINVCRTITNLETGNRVVATIMSIGNYSSIQETSGNYLVVTWSAANENENDVEVLLSEYVSQIGDTL
jgi:hypothetical protein